MPNKVCFQFREGDTVYGFHTLSDRHYVTEKEEKVTCDICLKMIALCRERFWKQVAEHDKQDREG